jgi:hypothetical protein
MKLLHKVEECAVYESNKQSYASMSSSSSSPSLPQIKTFLLKITSSNANAALALLSSVEKSVKHAHAHAYNHTSTSIKFKALKAIPLKTFIDNMHSQSLSKGMAYTLTLKLLADVGTQLERIRSERGLIIPFLSLEDIVVIETRNQDNQKQEEVSDNAKSESRESDSEYTFVFMNAEKLMQEPGPNKKDLIVDVPLKVNKHTSFLPAELPESALKRLPMRLTTTSWCYSLSALCIYALLQHKFKNGEDDIERVGRPFLHTSLYFCLKRCLKPDPEERVLLYV